MWNFKQTNKNKPEPKAAATESHQAVALESAPVKSEEVKPAVKATPKKAAAKVEKSYHSEGYFQVKERLHEEIIKEIDLKALSTSSAQDAKPVIQRLVNKILDDQKLPVNDDEREQLVIDMQDEILGLGPLETLLSDASISEIMVNRFDRVYVERSGLIKLLDIRFNDNQHLLKIIDKIITRVGRRIDESNPMADARLEDGSRVNAIIPPIALDGPALSIRKFSVVPLKAQDLINRKALSKEISDFLEGLVRAKTNILISGGTGSGKTTLLNILSGFIPDNERIITIEDTAELQLQQEHVIRLESRPPNVEGKGEITIRSLVRNSLRMRPDRVVLGEVRGPEVIDMLQAMNTGHDGSLATVHANSPRDALSRLESLIGMGGSSNISSKVLRQQISSAVNVIVQLSRLNDGSRKIMSIHEITGMEGDVISTQEIFFFDRVSTNHEGRIEGYFRATGVRPMLSEKLATYGVQLDKDIFDPDRIMS